VFFCDFFLEVVRHGHSLEVLLQKCGSKCSNITGIVVYFLG
jgi:hypothetical protein